MLNGKTLVQDIVHGNFSKVRDDIENEIAKKIVNRINDKKEDIIDSILSSRIRPMNIASDLGKGNDGENYEVINRNG
ncbi:MAG: hypothetical protein QXG00_06620 [Candidatus Woesearchaeota archaeon]